MSSHATTRVAAVLASAIDDQWLRFTTMWPAAVAGDAVATHQARVATRRLGETLRIVGRVGGSGRPKKFAEKLRIAARLLGPVRDLAVAQELVADRAVRHHREAASMSTLSAMLGRRQQRAQRRLGNPAARVRLDRLGGMASAIVASVRGRPAAGEWAAAVATVTARRVSNLAEALARCGTLYEPDKLHALRIAVKKLRYDVELADAAGLGSPGLAARLSVHQRRLGRWHDRVVLLQLVREVEVHTAPRPSAEWARLGRTLERECRAWHGRIERAREDLSACLDAARGLAAAAARSGRPVVVRAGLELRRRAHVRRARA